MGTVTFDAMRLVPKDPDDPESGQVPLLSGLPSYGTLNPDRLTKVGFRREGPCSVTVFRLKSELASAFVQSTWQIPNHNPESNGPDVAPGISS